MFRADSGGEGFPVCEEGLTGKGICKDKTGRRAETGCNVNKIMERKNNNIFKNSK